MSENHLLIDLGNTRAKWVRAQGRAIDSGSAGRGDIDALAAACRGDDNLIGPIVEAVKTYASVGEISDAMRGVFGEYTPATAV